MADLDWAGMQFWPSDMREYPEDGVSYSAAELLSLCDGILLLPMYYCVALTTASKVTYAGGTE